MTIDARGAPGEARHVWVAPPFDDPPTGGTLYTASLVTTLQERGVECIRLDVDDALRALARGDARHYWIDSLYLDSMPRLAASNVAKRSLWLVVHYLPSLVAHGDGLRSEQLSVTERAALASVDGMLVTSAYMARVLLALGVARPIIVVEPGITGNRAAAQPTLSDPPRVLLLANVTQGKGILTLLEEIARAVSPADRFELIVIGSIEREPTYANACAALIEGEERFRARVRFAGSLAHADALRELAHSDLFVSASRMESYGMALAEARAVGIPVLARAGGNAASHVVSHAGGELVPDVRELVARLFALVRDPVELLRRKRLALAHTPERTWDAAADDFLRGLGPFGTARVRE